MTNRREFLSNLEDQLSSWTDWVQELDDQALASAAKMRAKDSEAAKAVEQRAIQLRGLIQQGRGQFERLSGASDDAWDGVAGGAEQAWTALKDAAASLAVQPSPAANAPTVEAAAAKPRSAGKPRTVAKPHRASTKSGPAAKKKSAAVKKKAGKAVSPKAKAKAKAKSKSKSKSPAKAKRSAPKRKVVTKRKVAAKRKAAAKPAKRKLARKK